MLLPCSGRLNCACFKQFSEVWRPLAPPTIVSYLLGVITGFDVSLLCTVGYFCNWFTQIPTLLMLMIIGLGLVPAQYVDKVKEQLPIFTLDFLTAYADHFVKLGCSYRRDYSWVWQLLKPAILYVADAAAISLCTYIIFERLRVYSCVHLLSCFVCTGKNVARSAWFCGAVSEFDIRVFRFCLFLLSLCLQEVLDYSYPWPFDLYSPNPSPYRVYEWSRVSGVRIVLNRTENHIHPLYVVLCCTVFGRSLCDGFFSDVLYELLSLSDNSRVLLTKFLRQTHGSLAVCTDKLYD